MPLGGPFQAPLHCQNAPLQVTSNEIAGKVEEAERTEREIDVTREQYRRVAVRASLLFFCISDLAGVDPMYQYSLAWFIGLFLRTVAASPGVSVLIVCSSCALCLCRGVCVTDGGLRWAACAARG